MEPKQQPERELEWLGAQIAPAKLSDGQADPYMADVQWYTGATVMRMDYWTGEKYTLTLSMDPKHCSLKRLNSGAPLLNNHSSYSLEDVIGVCMGASIENGVGKASVRFSKRPEVDSIRADVNDGILRNVSVGAQINKLKDVTPEDSKMKSYLAIDWQPMEISAVPIGADAGAGFLSHQVVEPQIEPRAEAAHKETEMDEKEVARLAEVARLKAIEDEKQKNATEAIRLEAVTAERARVAGIEAALAPFPAIPAAFRAELIASGQTVDAARLAILTELAKTTQADPSRSNVAIIRDGDATRMTQMENVLLHRYNPNAHKLEAGRDYFGMTLLELAKVSLSARGIPVKGVAGYQIATLAFQGTTDFPNILANVANKSLRAAYDAEPQTFKPFTKRSTITDFKPVNRTQIGDVGTLPLVLPSGEFTHAKVTDAKETYSLATYGHIFSINRQALINDDMAAFTRIPESHGRSAARLESDTVWGIITANAALADTVALFHATHANLAGTATVITIAALGLGRKALRVQTGLNSIGYLNLTPKYLLVPAALETVAQQYTVQTNIIVATQAAVNPIGPTLTVIAEPRLDANSATAWYMAADPGQIDTVEYAYLAGQEGVYMETRMGFEVDGMEMKARLDFAAKALDFRGLYKNAGV